MQGALRRGAEGELDRKVVVRSLNITKAAVWLATGCRNLSKPKNGKNMFHFLMVM